NLGLETLAVRIERHCQNALEVATFLNDTSDIQAVYYLGLKTDRYHERMKKYTPEGASGVISFDIAGGKERAIKFMDALKLASNVVHVADIRTCVLYPASETHRQLTDEQLKDAGITPGLIRLSIGLEDIEDIIEDIRQAFDASRA
ncbi:PLP-dependent transferase, partial [Halolactibacillus sp. JCM 19043]